MTAITSRPDAQGKSRSHQGVGFGSTYECQLLRYSPRGISSERTQALNRLAHAVSSELSSSISQRTIWSARIFRNTLGACPSIRSCFRIVPWFSLGLCLLASAQPSARTIPRQLAPAPLERRQIFRRLCVKQISCHSADTFSSPRNRNVRIPRADLI